MIFGTPRVHLIFPNFIKGLKEKTADTPKVKEVVQQKTSPVISKRLRPKTLQKSQFSTTNQKVVQNHPMEIAIVDFLFDTTISTGRTGAIAIFDLEPKPLAVANCDSGNDNN